MQLQVDKLGKVAVTVEENYWSIDKDYDKLTIVEQEGNFGTFISRKPVPAGTPLTNRTYWIKFSSLKEEIVLEFSRLVNDLRITNETIEQKEEEIYKAMASLEAGGIVLMQTFGDSEIVGISQKALTEKIDDLQDQINSLHPGISGVIVEVDPTLLYDGEDTEITVTGSMADNSVADLMTITVGDESISEHNVSEMEHNFIVNATTTINVEAVQEGFTHEASTKVVGVRRYYVGSADSNYESLISDTYLKPIKANPKGTYNVNVPTNGYYVWFIVPSDMTINGATMSGFAFPLENPIVFENTSLVRGSYKAYRSSNTYDKTEEGQPLVIVIS